MWASIKRLSLGIFLILLASAVLLVSDWNRRQSRTSQVPRLALLQHASQPLLDEIAAGMIGGLAEAGFVDGQTVSIRRYNAEGDAATANTIAREITGGQYDLLLTVSTLSLQAVANANRTGMTRHIFAGVTDPVAAGVGISRENPLQHPPHLAGYGTMQPVAEAFQLARRLWPALHSVGVVWNPAEANSEAQLKVARQTSAALGLELVEGNVDAAAGVMEAASALVGRDVEALWVPGDVTVLTAVDSLISVAQKNRIPVFTSMPGHAPRGALFDLGANYGEVGRLAGILAGKVLRGTDPASLAITNLMPQKLMLNPTVLAGLKDPWQIPDDVVPQADTIIDATGTHPEASPPSRPPLARMWNVHVLEYVNVLDVEDGEHGIRAGLKEAGLVEGTDYKITVRNAQGDMPTISTLVDAALSDRADLLFTLSTPTLQATLQRVRQVPIVFTFVANAIAAGAGASATDHLPNVTGVTTASPYEELLATVRECLPGVRRVGTLFVPAEVNSVYNKDQLTAVARRQNMEVVAVAANTSAEMSDAAAALCNEGLDAVVQVGGNLTTAAFASITQAAQRAHVPLFGALTSNAHDGAAVVVARDYFDGGRDAGLMAARIMRGESPAAIPIEPLKTTRLLLNLPAARAMGLTIPPALRQRASEVIGR